jgi:hypothetical protein
VDSGGNQPSLALRKLRWEAVSPVTATIFCVRLFRDLLVRITGIDGEELCEIYNIYTVVFNLILKYRITTF